MRAMSAVSIAASVPIAPIAIASRLPGHVLLSEAHLTHSSAERGDLFALSLAFISDRGRLPVACSDVSVRA